MYKTQNVPERVSQQLRRQMNQLLGWKRTELPAMRPTLLTRSNVHHLVERDHFVHEMSKTGHRCMLLLLNGATYVINDSYQFEQLPLLHFPLRKDRITPGSTCLAHHWTLVETEWIPGDDSRKPQHLLFDLLLLNGRSMLNAPLLERLKKIQNDIVAPHARHYAKLQAKKSATGSTPCNSPLPCTVITKQLHPASKLRYIYRKSPLNISRLMFISMQAYHMGTCEQLYMWQPIGTAHFQLGIEWRGRPPEPGFKLMLSQRNTPFFFDWITFDDEIYNQMKVDPKSASMVVECGYDPQWATFIPGMDKSTWEVKSSNLSHPTKGLGWRQGGWYYIRSRKDKLIPDDMQYLEDVTRAIKDNISKEVSTAIDTTSQPAICEHVLSQELMLLVATVADQRTEEQEAARAQILAHAQRLQHEEQAVLPTKRKRVIGKGRGDVGAPDELGVCYDWQNKGMCTRGNRCPFAHCGCNTICTCTPENNTYGQRPVKRANESEDAPNVKSTSTSVIQSVSQDSTHQE